MTSSVRLALAAGPIALALALAACGGGDGSQETTSAARLPSGCEEVAAPEPKRVELDKPELAAEPPAPGLTATVETSCGLFEIALDGQTSPRTVVSFVHMAREGLYDGTSFHGISPGQVIQGGDPLGDGTGGPGYFVDEPPPHDTEYTRGVVAMAKSPVEPPGRSGSQFFVVTGADAALPPVYATLGEVSRGFSTIERIETLGDPGDETGTPTATVVIESVAIGGE